MCKAPTALILMAAAVCLSLTLSGQEVAISSVAVQGEHVTLGWRGPSGWNHVLQYTTLLPATQWTDVLTLPSAPEMNERTLLLPAGWGYGFYRVVCGASLDSPGPRLFFTDLESGPNRGGQDDLGCYVTLWGEGFGASRGESKVTMGGREVARYVEWGQDNAWARQATGCFQNWCCAARRWHSNWPSKERIVGGLWAMIFHAPTAMADQGALSQPLAATLPFLETTCTTLGPSGSSRPSNTTRFISPPTPATLR